MAHLRKYLILRIGLRILELDGEELPRLVLDVQRDDLLQEDAFGQVHEDMQVADTLLQQTDLVNRENQNHCETLLEQ